MTSMVPSTEHLVNGELDVVAIGIRDDADVTNYFVAIHRPQQQASAPLSICPAYVHYGRAK